MYVAPGEVEVVAHRADIAYAGRADQSTLAMSAKPVKK
jgi:hypothetical protein